MFGPDYRVIDAPCRTYGCAETVNAIRPTLVRDAKLGIEDIHPAVFEQCYCCRRRKGQMSMQSDSDGGQTKPRRKAAWGWLSLAKACLLHPHQIGARQQ
jgi:hypothetical protein